MTADELRAERARSLQRQAEAEAIRYAEYSRGRGPMPERKKNGFQNFSSSRGKKSMHYNAYVPPFDFDNPNHKTW